MKKRKKTVIGIFLLLLTVSAGLLFYFSGNETLVEEDMAGKEAVFLDLC